MKRELEKRLKRMERSVEDKSQEDEESLADLSDEELAERILACYKKTKKEALKTGDTEGLKRIEIDIKLCEEELKWLRKKRPFTAEEEKEYQEFEKRCTADIKKELENDPESIFYKGPK